MNGTRRESKTMNAHDAFIPTGFSGEFDSEVCLPVRVKYTVDSQGHIELTQVVNLATFKDLPLKERRNLENEARQEVARIQKETQTP